MSTPSHDTRLHLAVQLKLWLLFTSLKKTQEVKRRREMLLSGSCRRSFFASMKNLRRFSYHYHLLLTLSNFKFVFFT